MKNPLISVVIPNYNHAQFIEKRIESVLNQTYKNIEIILLDDKSTDNSIDIIKKYEQNPVVSHVLQNTENSGSPFLQWKKGVSMSKGDLVWIAESDDLCENDLLETLVKEFTTDNECALAFCKSMTINSTGDKTTYTNIITFPMPVLLFSGGMHFHIQMIHTQNTVDAVIGLCGLKFARRGMLHT